MKDFINHFRKDSKHLDHKDSEPKDDHIQKNPQVELAKEMINAYRDSYSDVDLKVLRNLIELKDITSESKKAKPDHSYKEIEKRLGTSETEETLVQERWHGKVKCPACGSKNIKKLSSEQQNPKEHYKYQCQDCLAIFDDASGTPLESGKPPLHTWMFCWYLLGCTDSLQYIATKLGLELPMVEYMVRHMQKLFKSQKPLAHFSTFEEWSFKHGKSYKQKIQHEMEKKELHQGETAATPQDTHEYNRQKARARNPQSHTPHIPKPKNRGG
jgi:transposase-like protein